jgi:hypothetical protein
VGTGGYEQVQRGRPGRTAESDPPGGTAGRARPDRARTICLPGTTAAAVGPAGSR